VPAGIQAIARLSALGELAAALSRATSPREVAEIVAERGLKVADADVCTVHVPGPNGSLVLAAARGVDPSVLDQIREITTASNNPALATMQSGDAIWVETEEQYRALYPALAVAGDSATRARAFWSVPLVSEGRAIALLGMGYYEERKFLPDERAFVTTFATQCAEALRRTERAEAERAVRDRAEALRASFETTLRSIGDAVITTDASGLVTLMNPIAERLTGWSEHEALGRPSHDVFRITNEHTREPVPSPVDEALREGTIVALANHTLLLHRDGVTETPIEDSGAPIRGVDAAVRGVVLVFRDVSAKKARDARRQYLERATSALAESLDYETTVKRVAQLAVPSIADWCAVEVVDEGTSKSRQIAVAHVDPTKVEYARTLAARYPPDPDAPAGAPNVLRTGRSELYAYVTDEMMIAGARDAEHLAVVRELQLRSVLFAPLVVRGRVLGVITFVHAESGRHYSEEDVLFAEDLARRCAIAIDNARLYAAELTARRAAVVANRTKDEFLAMMSHELRTPLSSIMGWSKLLMAPTADASLLARGLDVIHRNTIAMGALIEDLLDLSRITSGKIRLDVRRVELAKIVETAVESARANAQAKDLQLETSIASDLGPFRGDATRLAQIVSNLLSNAVKFTPKGGRIDVSLRRTSAGDSFEIEVVDTGQGIDAAFLPRVFELFQQEEGRPTRSKGGLGLGLSISRQLAELHGGTITAASEGPGKGARFVVRLPVPAPEPDRARTDAARSSGTMTTTTSLTGIRVLTVDDDDDARAFVKAALELRGASVRTASSVVEALAELDRELPDVLLSDIGMPVRDGYSLIRELRERPPERGGALPAAAVSAFAYAHDREASMRAGFAEHLAKPVDPNDLVALVLRLAKPA